jgi:hypothetical protein
MVVRAKVLSRSMQCANMGSSLRRFILGIPGLPSRSVRCLPSHYPRCLRSIQFIVSGGQLHTTFVVCRYSSCRCIIRDLMGGCGWQNVDNVLAGSWHPWNVAATCPVHDRCKLGTIAVTQGSMISLVWCQLQVQETPQRSECPIDGPGALLSPLLPKRG